MDFKTFKSRYIEASGEANWQKVETNISKLARKLNNVSVVSTYGIQLELSMPDLLDVLSRADPSDPKSVSDEYFSQIHEEESYELYNEIRAILHAFNATSKLIYQYGIQFDSGEILNLLEMRV